MNFELRALAEAEMVEIARYTAETYSAAQARKHLASLDALFTLLASQPTLGPAAAELGTTIRRMPHHEHVVYYQPRLTGGVMIIRVLHKRMLPSTHF